MHLPPPPDPRELLPPLLACLPTAFISPRPPPALLPLLSPLLRQRVAFLGGSSANSSDTNSGWLPLLTWDASRAAKLPAVVEQIELEPHPVSGEVEIEDVRPAKYRRLDEETLQARLEVEQFGLLPIFVWCESDEHAGSAEGGGSGAGWKLAELRALEDVEEDAGEWGEGIVEADEAAEAKMGRSIAVPQVNGAQNGNEDDDEDDDDYWASYDRTPGRGPTPAKSSPARGTQAAGRGRSQSELDYYSRYGSEVQPALDAHDPDEENAEMGQSTLNGGSLVRQQARQAQQQRIPPPQESQPEERPISRPNGTSLFPADDPSSSSNTKPNISLLSPTTSLPNEQDVSHPSPISPTDSQTSVERLEQKAAAMSEDADRAHTAIKQHISTDIKSLFRLAKSTGMARREFERIVSTELECLGFLEENE